MAGNGIQYISQQFKGDLDDNNLLIIREGVSSE